MGIAPDMNLDAYLIAYARSLRDREHRSVPQIHKALKQKGVNICQRSVSNVLDRY